MTVIDPDLLREHYPEFDLMRYGVPGDGGYILRHLRPEGHVSSVIVSHGLFAGADWVHASIAHSDRMPSYEDLVHLHSAIGKGWAIQVFAPPEHHVNIHANALHLWARADGVRTWPNFGATGSI